MVTNGKRQMERRSIDGEEQDREEDEDGREDKDEDGKKMDG